MAEADTPVWAQEGRTAASPPGNKPSVCLIKVVNLIFWICYISLQAVRCFPCLNENTTATKYHFAASTLGYGHFPSIFLRHCQEMPPQFELKLQFLTYTCLTGATQQLSSWKAKSCSSRQDVTWLCLSENIHCGSWWMNNVMHKFSSMCLFLFTTLYMFRAHSAQHRERQLFQYSLW